VQYFGLKASPTEHILDLWQAREAGTSTAIVQLLQTVRAMGRLDAAALLDAHLHSGAVSMSHPCLE